MGKNLISYDYSPYGDITVASISIMLFFLLISTYTKKNFQYKILFASNISIFISSITSIIYNDKIRNVFPDDLIHKIELYFMHYLSNITLIYTWCLFFLYLFSIKNNNKKERNIKNMKWTLSTLILYTLSEIICSITKVGFHIEGNLVYEHFILNPFSFFYVFLATFFIYCFITNRFLFPPKTYFYILVLSIYCFTTMIFSVILNTTTFYTFAFLIPTLFIYMLFHGNSFNIESGTLSFESFISLTEELINKKEEFTIITVYISENNGNIDTSFNNLASFCSNNFKKSILFKENRNKLNIIIRENNISNQVNLLNNFIKNKFNKNNIETKLIIITNNKESEINDVKKFIDFSKFILRKTKINSSYKQSKEDYNQFLIETYIREQLLDIGQRNNLNDERVVVFCQPILNSKNTFRNAEVLMRLNLPKIGMVYPDKFIPIAEEYDLIHPLSLIILNKTCIEIKKLLNENYQIDRFSINFSSREFNNPNLYNEITNIVDNSGISYDKLAFEITETFFSKINDLNLIMNQLIKKGIVFYLDDFGTGYSNIDRITELPFLTIKFDRSLVLSSMEKDNSRFIVKNLCNLFNSMKYEILFEGIEDEEAEILCKSMGAKYFQGYKYSKPIPIENVKDYLEKK